MSVKVNKRLFNYEKAFYIQGDGKTVKPAMPWRSGCFAKKRSHEEFISSETRRSEMKDTIKGLTDYQMGYFYMLGQDAPTPPGVPYTLKPPKEVEDWLRDPSQERIGKREKIAKPYKVLVTSNKKIKPDIISIQID